MEQITARSTRRSILRVCVDRMEHFELIGHVESPLLGRESFNGVLRLLNIMEHFYDTINFPQGMFQMRSFATPATRRRGRPRTVSPEPTASRAQHNPEPLQSPLPDFQEQPGRQATFVVYVVFRQNASWQGTVEWVDRGVLRQFRSTLELLALIQNAIHAREPALDPKWYANPAE